ncbi:MAG TPA: hypothetical protein VFU32_15610 [Ktedonobacterales bacterium]|nr:hypothetical protein [Ktedonobacterales bacterium]
MHKTSRILEITLVTAAGNAGRKPRRTERSAAGTAAHRWQAEPQKASGVAGAAFSRRDGGATLAAFTRSASTTTYQPKIRDVSCLSSAGTLTLERTWRHYTPRYRG